MAHLKKLVHILHKVLGKVCVCERVNIPMWQRQIGKMYVLERDRGNVCVKERVNVYVGDIE